MTHLLVMEGDGIGPEITAATLEVLGAAARVFALDLSFTPVAVGFAAPPPYVGDSPAWVEDVGGKGAIDVLSETVLSHTAAG